MDDKSNILSYSVTSKIPSELQTSSNEIDIKTIIALQNDTDPVTFRQGDTIKNAYAFNQYLAANVVSGAPLTMTKAQVMSMVKKLSMQLSNGGLDSLAMVCTDTECPRYHSCSIVQSGIAAPVGEQCPIEKAEVANHMKRLALDFDDLPSYADQLTVQAVVGCELLKSRVYADMANNPEAVIEVGKGMDRQGNPIIDRVDNPNQKIWAQVNKTEQTLLKSLHMTMEQKKKIEEGSKKRTPDAIRELYKERLRQLKDKNKLGDDVIDVDVTKGDQHEEVHSGSDGGAVSSDSRGTDQSGGREQSPELHSTPDEGDARDSREGIGVVGRTKDRIEQIKERRGRDGESDPRQPNESRGNEGAGNAGSGADDDSMEAIF